MLDRREDALLDAWWKAPEDVDTLRVLADVWSEDAGPRGEFVQLSLLRNPTVEQREKREALLKKAKGALVGPARPFLREWEFGSNGVVERARCEADKLAEGIEEIARLNPHLCLCVTSLKKQSTIKALSKVSLARIHFVTFTMGLIGSLGGSNVSDRALAGVAPAFRGVKNIGLQARGHDECFSPVGLRALAEHLDGIELIVLDFYRATDPGKTPLPPLNDYLDVFVSHPAFQSLKAIAIYSRAPRDDGAVRAAFTKALPNLVNVVTGDVLCSGAPDSGRRFPRSAQDIAALVAGR